MKRRFVMLPLCLLVAVAVCGILFYNGLMGVRAPSEQAYPIRGVDVSAYQGTIDWPVLAGQGIDFAYLKATEGADYLDARFDENLVGARETDLAVGAYHFFSFSSGGREQAENFITVVPRLDGMLPPVVDLELYGSYLDNPPAREDVRRELIVLLNALEQAYGVRPILYTSTRCYRDYLAGAEEKYAIWIRGVWRCPTPVEDDHWDFWQYSGRGKLEGYSGREEHIDLDVFCGSTDEFAAYPRIRT